MIVGVLRGGPSVGQGTLNRFFAAHEAIGGSTIQSTAIGTLYLHGGYVPSRNGMLRNASGTSSRRTSMSVGIGISAHKVVLGFNWVHSRSEGMAYKCFWHPTLSRRRHECQLKCQLDGNNVTDGLHSSSSSLNRLSSGAHAHGLITSQTGSYTASRGSYTSIRGELTGQAGKLCFNSPALLSVRTHEDASGMGCFRTHTKCSK